MPLKPICDTKLEKINLKLQNESILKKIYDTYFIFSSKMKVKESKKHFSLTPLIEKIC